MAADYIPYTGPIVTRAEAKAAGLKRYFVPRPCPKGHVSQRTVCDGQCVECQRLKQKTRVLNRPKLAEAARARYRADPEKYKAKVRSRQRQFPEKVAANGKRWRSTNLARSKDIGRRYYTANKDLVIQRTKDWIAANPERARARSRLVAMRRRARKRNAEGSHTQEDIVRIQKQQRDRCAHCRIKLRGKGTVDHIIALSRGGSNWPNNLQLLCPQCNSAKHAKDPIDFSREHGRLL